MQKMTDRSYVRRICLGNTVSGRKVGEIVPGTPETEEDFPLMFPAGTNFVFPHAFGWHAPEPPDAANLEPASESPTMEK